MRDAETFLNCIFPVVPEMNHVWIIMLKIHYYIIMFQQVYIEFQVVFGISKKPEVTKWLLFCKKTALLGTLTI